MARRKISESLSARVFAIAFLLLLAVGSVLFGLIAWASPVTYTAVVNDDLQQKLDALVQELAETDFADSGAALDAFIRSAGVQVALENERGEIVETPSLLALRTVSGDGVTVVSDGEAEDASQTTVSVTTADVATAAVRFADGDDVYTLYVTPNLRAENIAVRALAKMAPWILLALLGFSLVCALVFARLVARPIVRLSAIAEKMAELDFGWRCALRRRDEIGSLGRSLERLAQRLSAALGELSQANCALRGEMERERAREQERLAFFSAASHELKTPVTILKGQIGGMLDGVGVYRDRDKYLARALQTTARMEKLVGELLAVSRLEGAPAPAEAVSLSQLTRRQLAQDAELFSLRGLKLRAQVADGLSLRGNAAMLSRALGALFSNAALYSPEGAEVSVLLEMREERPVLTVVNAGAHICEDALPHLFEAFFRAEPSRSRDTGGSGLGLYLAKLIFDRHGAACSLENVPGGVRATVVFPGPGGT